MNETLLRFENLTLGYDRHPAIHHLNYTVQLGDMTAVVGPNGAGKSTLLKGIAGLLLPLGGEIRLNGIGRSHIAYLPQQVDMDRTFPLSVFDMVAMGLWQKVGAFGGFSRRSRQRVAEALTIVGLDGFERRIVGTLSGGQMQRALFARLLLQDARLILLDEPFTAIDSVTTRDLMALIHRWHEEARTVIAVLHDLDQVRVHFPKTLLLARRQVAAGPTGEVLTSDNLERAQRLPEAFDDTALPCSR